MPCGRNAARIRVSSLETGLEHPLPEDGRQAAVAGEDAEGRQLKCDAWMFGWLIEDSVRHIDTTVNGSFIRSAG